LVALAVFILVLVCSIRSFFTNYPEGGVSDGLRTLDLWTKNATARKNEHLRHQLRPLAADLKKATALLLAGMGGP